MSKHDKMGYSAFLGEYANHRAPKAHFLRYSRELYPVKALWAAAHRPAIHTRDFNTYHAVRGLRALGFDQFELTQKQRDVLPSKKNNEAVEGERIKREIDVLSRSRKIVQQAKMKYGYKCMVCQESFADIYGPIGEGLIECHHIVPISGRATASKITKIEDLAVVCANCHRMLHWRQDPPRTIPELRKLYLAAKRARTKAS
jgi:predicted HNH restriction endonuclease